jgi:RNA polymerase sigma-70 factor (ECF subfamily)
MTLSESLLSAFRQDASCTQGQMRTGTKPRVSSSGAGLIQRILGGENGAFGELARRYEGAAFMTARAILHSDGDAEDAAQEAVLNAFSNCANVRGDAKFSTWLFRIATNEALMKLRKNRRRLPIHWTSSTKTSKVTALPGISVIGARFPPRQCSKRSCARRLLRALGSLTPKHREVFVPRDVRHFSIAETANLLGLTKSAVKTRLMRARLQMRYALAPRVDGDRSL